MGQVLIIDDEVSVRNSFRDMLEARGHQVHVAARADDVVALVESTMSDVVVMDNCMPGISGLAALQNLKLARHRLPVIIMTGKGTMETAIEAMKYGAFDYQLKPFNPSAMLAAIERAIESSRL